MSSFRYQAIAVDGAPVNGVIEADDRRTALQLLGSKGLFPSRLEVAAGAPAPSPTNATATATAATTSSAGGSSSPAAAGAATAPVSGGWGFGSRVGRKDITAFSRQMAALLGASIPIPQALEGLGEEEENPALRDVLLGLSAAVRSGSSFSGALGAYPKLFSTLYVSMIRVGEEAGALPGVMTDLANLLEQEAEVRGEVRAAVAYPLFVLGFGIATVVFLLTVVLPKLFSMLEEMRAELPLPTVILLGISTFLNQYWWVLLLGLVGTVAGLRYYLRTPKGAFFADAAKLQVPFLGGMFRAAALGRFARTLGTLVHSGVSLLPALKIVEATLGNLALAARISQVTEETRSGSSLAAAIRRMGLFPRSVVQMISVGEETGRLDDMLLQVATLEERQMRNKTKTVISLLAPVLILVVGAIVGFMVIAILLPIFRMSRGIH